MTGSRLVGGRGHRPYLCQRESNWRVKVSSAAEIPRICGTQSSSQRMRHAQSPSVVPGTSTCISSSRENKKNKKKTRLYVACSSFFDSGALRPNQKVDGNAHNDSRLFPIRWLPVEKTSKADAILRSRLSSAAAGAFV